MGSETEEWADQGERAARSANRTDIPMEPGWGILPIIPALAGGTAARHVSSSWLSWGVQ